MITSQLDTEEEDDDDVPPPNVNNDISAAGQGAPEQATKSPDSSGVTEDGVLITDASINPVDNPSLVRVNMDQFVGDGRAGPRPSTSRASSEPAVVRGRNTQQAKDLARNYWLKSQKIRAQINAMTVDFEGTKRKVLRNMKVSLQEEVSEACGFHSQVADLIPCEEVEQDLDVLNDLVTSLKSQFYLLHPRENPDDASSVVTSLADSSASAHSVSLPLKLVIEQERISDQNNQELASKKETLRLMEEQKKSVQLQLEMDKLNIKREQLQGQSALN